MQLPLFALAPKRLTCCTVKPSLAIVYSLTGPTAVPRGVGNTVAERELWGLGHGLGLQKRSYCAEEEEK